MVRLHSGDCAAANAHCLADGVRSLFVDITSGGFVVTRSLDWLSFTLSEMVLGPDGYLRVQPKRFCTPHVVAALAMVKKRIKNSFINL